MQSAGVESDDYTYSSLISACAKGKQWRKAEEAFEQMKAAGVTPDIPTYKPLLSVLWECSHRAKAIELFVEASEAGVYPQGDRKIDLHELSQGRGAGIADSVAGCDGGLDPRGLLRWTASDPQGGDGLGRSPRDG